MIELRQVNCGDGSFRLEQRTRNVTCDASGAFAGFTEWSEWGPVPTVRESETKSHGMWPNFMKPIYPS